MKSMETAAELQSLLVEGFGGIPPEALWWIETFSRIAFEQMQRHLPKDCDIAAQFQALQKITVPTLHLCMIAACNDAERVKNTTMEFLSDTSDNLLHMVARVCAIVRLFPDKEGIDEAFEKIAQARHDEHQAVLDIVQQVLEAAQNGAAHGLNLVSGETLSTEQLREIESRIKSTNIPSVDVSNETPPTTSVDDSPRHSPTNETAVKYVPEYDDAAKKTAAALENFRPGTWSFGTGK